MKPKVYFAKILSFQRSLSPGEIWTNEKLSIYRDVPVKPSNEVAMWGYVRHMTKQMFTHKNKKYLREKVKIPIGVVQMAERRFEDILYPVWGDLDIKDTDLREIERMNKDDELEIPPTVIEIFDMQVKKARPVIEVGKRSTEDQLVMPEYLIIDIYAGELSKYFRSYLDFIDYLLEEGKLRSLVIDEKKERHFIVAI